MDRCGESGREWDGNCSLAGAGTQRTDRHSSLERFETSSARAAKVEAPFIAAIDRWNDWRRRADRLAARHPAAVPYDKAYLQPNRNLNDARPTKSSAGIKKGHAPMAGGPDQSGRSTRISGGGAGVFPTMQRRGVPAVRYGLGPKRTKLLGCVGIRCLDANCRRNGVFEQPV